MGMSELLNSFFLTLRVAGRRLKPITWGDKYFISFFLMLLAICISEYFNTLHNKVLVGWFFFILLPRDLPLPSGRIASPNMGHLANLRTYVSFACHVADGHPFDTSMRSQ